MSVTPKEADDLDRPFPRLRWRRRALIALLAVATAITVVTTLLHPPGGVHRIRAMAADVAACAPGQTTACVGGTAEVIMMPGPAASASR